MFVVGRLLGRQAGGNGGCMPPHLRNGPLRMRSARERIHHLLADRVAAGSTPADRIPRVTLTHLAALPLRGGVSYVENLTVCVSNMYGRL
ncbi:hypothetical protein CMUS01_01644 [Colletotrichum musicola]|uniref:Uncharacterized protein n=1 Tax=Colletotrichum musicola TaxID=2175873 RepID=A0A8H6NWH2_9PEZI|nr:hypothetical protein CMUS01_01644 [Colletotrichum musicola]